jgi:large subunit ribosomal protein L17
MRHRITGRRLGVPANRRKALLKQLVSALFLHGRIKTTVARAKETRPLAERMITWAKKGDLHHRRMALSLVTRKDIVHRLFDTIAPWYQNRMGGYTRIIRVGQRPGDASEMAFIELVDWVAGEKLSGQHTKVVKPVSEEEAERQKTKQAKEKKKETKTKKTKAAQAKPVKKKVVKTLEKEEKISKRAAEKEKQKKEKAALRDVNKKAKLEAKAQSKAESGGKKKKKAVKKAVKKTAPRAVKKAAPKKKTKGKSK